MEGSGRREDPRGERVRHGPEGNALHQYYVRSYGRWPHHSQSRPTVEKAYNFWLEKTKEKFDWRHAGYLKSYYSPEDDWNEWLAKRREDQYVKEHHRALDMVKLLEPYRNAPFVEPDWMTTERIRKERQAKEAVKAIYKANGTLKPGIHPPRRERLLRVHLQAKRCPRALPR